MRKYLKVPEKTIAAFRVVITEARVNGMPVSFNKRIKMDKNSTLSMDFEIRDSSGEIATIFTGEAGNFSVPVAVVRGAVIESIALQFTDGVATLTEADVWTKSGEYEITEDLLNLHINPSDMKFLFTGLNITVSKK